MIYPRNRRVCNSKLRTRTMNQERWLAFHETDLMHHRDHLYLHSAQATDPEQVKPHSNASLTVDHILRLRSQLLPRLLLHHVVLQVQQLWRHHLRIPARVLLRHRQRYQKLDHLIRSVAKLNQKDGLPKRGTVGRGVQLGGKPKEKQDEEVRNV